MSFALLQTIELNARLTFTNKYLQKNMKNLLNSKGQEISR